jgi:methionyl-tRNA synthetase
MSDFGSESDSIRLINITTPIYYPNGLPHIGHAYTGIACDVLVRFWRMIGCNVKFSTGTDEHGQKIFQTAAAKGISPQEYVDVTSEKFRELNKLLNISQHVFVRTTESKHKKVATDIWNRMKNNGYIYLGNYEGFYAERDEAYYAEADLVDGRAPTGAEVQLLREPCYFFKLSAMQEFLLDLYKTSDNFIMPESRKNEVVSFVSGGLRDLAISRSRLTWGVSVPEDSGHVMYVWIDALCNYITALNYLVGDDETAIKQSYEIFEKFMHETVHVVGKDIVIFHAVYWPAFLKAAELPLPKRIFAHGWWKVQDEKMSKSLGNVISPEDLLKFCGVDELRFFLMKEISFGSDGNISANSVARRVNGELCNNFGNLVQRVIAFAMKNFVTIEDILNCMTEDSSVNQNEITETPASTSGNFDTESYRQKFDTWGQDSLSALSEMMECYEINKYIGSLLEASREANQYIDYMEPWKVIKTDKPKACRVISSLLVRIAQIAFFFYPVMPKACEDILRLLAHDNILKRLFDAESGVVRNVHSSAKSAQILSNELANILDKNKNLYSLNQVFKIIDLESLDA